ncbi:WD40 repeat-like protein [Pseudovirgaria hyperparasitica]|uniref:WD40 repeat-like protein n=1 Tax=Pseudovirgaria hyperparasitica TaxID=470096 RepID=A0A6A6W965_9PEZI|nr:WD40 repeat-like protein [Pseudovirgaria hyperparasitica]KAF2758436.1 WD40 repeat-like protein [Pseudovirgaria hyperparasitica]
MATDVTRLEPVRGAKRISSITAEERYWKSFSSQLQLPSPNSQHVTYISHPPPSSNSLVSPTPEVFAVTAGQRIQIFSSRTRKLLKTITRFNPEDIAYSGTVRRDGRILLAGGNNGVVQAFDVNSRAILKQFKEHKQPVWCTQWHPRDLTTAMSTSDDQTVRLWDLPSDDSTHKFYGHTDYVRCGTFMPGQTDRLLVSGSYDTTVRLWDPRTTGKAVMTFKHAAAVESVLPLPSGTTLLAAAGNTVSVLDVIGARPITQLKNHQKTVTTMALASRGTRLLTGGLDGHIKVFETAAWNVVAGFKYPNPILSLDVISSGAKQEDKHIAVGTSTGLVSIRTRLSAQQKLQQREREREMDALAAGRIEEYDRKKGKPLTSMMKKRLRGKDFTGEGVDIVVEGPNRGRLRGATKWEHALRKGQFEEALDYVLDPTLNFKRQDCMTLLTTLRHRSALRAALQNRDEVSLQPILVFLRKTISDPRFVKLTTDVAMVLLDIYGPHMGLSPEIDKLVKDLHDAVRLNFEIAQWACSITGMVDLLMVGAENRD